MNLNFATPPLLHPGDLVAILSPASAVDPQLVSGASEALCNAGFRVETLSGACGRSGTYSGSVESRLADMRAVLANSDVKAILCSRGGYGCVHLLGSVAPRPVWLIGFSDVSALHALWLSSGVRSVHGSMAKELSLRLCPGDEANRRLIQILTSGVMPSIEWGADMLNRPGLASGVLLGGNLAVLDGLAGTPYNIIGVRDSILVIEDIAEPVYKVERIMHRLRLSGAFDRIAGLVVGQFTDYRPDANGETMEEMIARMVAPYSFPVAFNAPIGHINGNLPFVEGCRAVLKVSASGVVLSDDSSGRP